MQVENHRWHSDHTAMEMPVVRYGHQGPPLLYLPTSDGDHTEFGRYGLHEDCARWIEAGRVQIFSADGFGRESFWNDALAPRGRIARYASYERYAVLELLPWILSVAQSPDLGVVGPSYGAFIAANLFFKHPDQVRVACGLGGVYGLWHRLEGYHDDVVYSHTPLEYLPRLRDTSLLEAIHATRGIHLMGAENDPWLPSTLELRRALVEKGIGHHVDIWPAPADHHERWWKQQLQVFLERCYS